MKKVLRCLLKTVLWTLGGIIGLVALLLIALYLPPVQDFIVPKVLERINKPGEMEISVGRLRLHFPLDVTVDSLRLLTPAMEVEASRANLDVALLPLITGEIHARDLSLDGTQFRLGTPDSLFYMKAAVIAASIEDARVRLSKEDVNIGRLLLDSGRVEMAIRPDTVPKNAPDTTSVGWHIRLDRSLLTRVNYNMTIDPTITDLSCRLDSGQLNGVDVDMLHKKVDVNELLVDRLNAKYIYPTPEYLAAHPAPQLPADTTATVPWTVNVARIDLSSSQALYAMNNSRPISSNFDLNYIEVSDIDIEIDSLYNRGTALRAPIRTISGRERCGIPLMVKGLFEMDSTAMNVRGFTLTTATSAIYLDAMMGMEQKSDLPFRADLTAEISNDDLRRLAPAGLAPIVDGLPRGVPLLARVDARGTMEDITVKSAAINIPRHLKLEASGRVAGVSDIMKATGELSLTGSMPDGSFLKPTLMDAKTARMVNLPPMTIDGNVDLNRGNIAADIAVTAADGTLSLSGEWHNRVQGYALTLDMHRFPLQKILPSLGVSNLTATVNLDGEGLDPFSPRTSLEGNVDLEHVGYQGVAYNNLAADIALHQGHAAIKASSSNPGAKFIINADGNLTGDTLCWNFAGDIADIDLQRLKLSDSIASGSVNLGGSAAFTLPRREVFRRNGRKIVRETPMTLDADVNINSLYWRMPGGTVNATDLNLKALLDTAFVGLNVSNKDLHLSASADVGLDTLLKQVNDASGWLTRAVEKQRYDIDSLQMLLPPLKVDLSAGPNNVLASYLMDSEITFESLRLGLFNDSTNLIMGSGSLLGFNKGTMKIDSIGFDMHQRNNVLYYNIVMDNRPGTFDQFAHVVAHGYVGAENFSLIVNQKNIQGETGFSFGSVVTMSGPETFTLRFVPYSPVIGYKDWTINRDNFISYNLKSHHVDANINLKNAVSSLRLFTEHSDNDSVQEDIHLQLNDIKIQDWLAINPFAPPMMGDLSADLKVNFGDKSLNGDGTVSLHDFYYGKEKVGDFDVAVDVQTNAAGTIRANTSLMVDGVKTITLSGNLNDSTALNPFLMDFRMIHFPLSVVNPFLPPGTARMSGMLNGEMDVTGDMSSPILNGWLSFDSTAVNVNMLGSALIFPQDSIPVKNSLVTFNNYDIRALNDNPLIINGTVDIANLSAARLNLTMKARNTQIVGSQKKRGQDVYGKAFIDLDAKVRGDLSRYLIVDADAKILPGTNVTYVVSDVQQAIASRSNSEMVKFVNFTDTAAVAAADSLVTKSMALIIDASLEISDGSTIGVDLSSDGKNRAQIQASGRVNYTSDYLGDDRVTGRINLNQGFVRYGMPPVLSEKLFHIEEGSYVVFNGPMLNPVLNLHAYDEIKANVNTDGNSRMATFNVKLGVTGTLEAMNVAFDLDSPDDLSVENELQSMSPDQRANQAMNMLLYGQYTGPGTKGSSMGNPLYSFLEGQLNNLASSAIKGVDISFGIDQLDRTRDGVNSSAMSYSYRVSKSLFDDRFKIVVGGNYTTDADADENFSQNLISDISFEYMINKTGTMYVKLFRHTGYESILEGEITQTGVGFVYKKKLRSLRDLFNWFTPRRKEEAAHDQ